MRRRRWPRQLLPLTTLHAGKQCNLDWSVVGIVDSLNRELSSGASSRKRVAKRRQRAAERRRRHRMGPCCDALAWHRHYCSPIQSFSNVHSGPACSMPRAAACFILAQLEGLANSKAAGACCRPMRPCRAAAAAAAKRRRRRHCLAALRAQRLFCMLLQVLTSGEHTSTRNHSSSHPSQHGLGIGCRGGEHPAVHNGRPHLGGCSPPGCLPVGSC